MENSACLLEAQQIIDDWLKDDNLGAVRYKDGGAPSSSLPQYRVKTTKDSNEFSTDKSFSQLHNVDPLSLPTEHNGGFENTDYITGMDFVNTDISRCVEQVMAGMYTQPVEHDVLKMIKSHQTVNNPTITMEMRHKQVKSRRQQREHHRSILLKAQVAEKESRLAAERRVKSEQEALKMKQRQEEALVKLEMVKIRKQLKEKQERDQLLQELDETLGSSGTCVTNNVAPSPRGVLSTAKQVMDEELKHRMIAETRRVLVKQLAEAELLEVKENSKLLRRCFNTWLNVTNTAKLMEERARAMWVWQTKCRVFKSWQRLVEQNKRQQELATMALQLQWEKRCVEMATLHYHHSVVTKVFTSWKRWLRGCQEARSREQMRQNQLHKMTTLLARVTEACQNDPSTVEKECQHESFTLKKKCQDDPSVVEKKCHHNPSIEGGHCSTNSSGCHHDPPMLGKKRQPVCHHNPPALKKENTTVGLITSKLVRQELEKLLAEKRILTSQDAVAPDHVSPVKVVTAPVATVVSESVHKQQQKDITVKKRPLTVKTSHPSLSDQQQSHKTLTHQLPTKPLPLLGMERRAHMMAERRQARIERQKQKEEQMLAAKQKEQQEREEAALAEKEALIRRKREERQLAKQKQKEKQRQLVEFQQKLTIATQHYNSWLLKYRGMLPWKQFITKIHDDNKLAAQFHIECVSKAVLLAWKQHYESKCEQRNNKADQFYVAMVTKRSLRAWKKYVQDMKYISSHAVQWYKWLLVKQHFKSWHAYVRQQEVKMWEKERRAKVHYYWSLKRRIVLSWHQFIPVAKEERLREQRRDELRKKVANWLPDYKTATNSED